MVAFEVVETANGGGEDGVEDVVIKEGLVGPGDVRVANVSECVKEGIAASDGGVDGGG